MIKEEQRLSAIFCIFIMRYSRITVRAMEIQVLSSLKYLLTSMAFATTLLTVSPANATVADKQINCLAANIYHEAGNQPTKGKIAVSNVVMNRVKSGRFPTTPCAVINQRRGRICQFSWVCSGSRIRDRNLYNESLEIARKVYVNNVDVTNGALFFHADHVRPSWSRVYRKTTRIGDHVFYRG